jgi:hypothetical protein
MRQVGLYSFLADRETGEGLVQEESNRTRHEKVGAPCRLVGARALVATEDHRLLGMVGP